MDAPRSCESRLSSSDHVCQELLTPPLVGHASSLIREASRTYMLAICAEPGLGQEVAFSHLLLAAERMGIRVIRRDFALRAPEAVSATMVRVAREVSRSAVSSIVAFDNVPASDESCVRRQARALRRLWESGVSTIFSIAPEGAQLIEALPECTILMSQDLLISSVMEAEREDSLHGLKALTWGIPSLLTPLLNCLDGDGRVCRIPHEYYDALSQLCSSFLRLSLSDDMICARLAVLLLGSGSSRELSHVLGHDAAEVLSSLRASAPFVEVSGSLEQFRCLLTDDWQALSACAHALREASALFPEVCPSCIEILVSRGFFKRAARLFCLPHAELAGGTIVSRASSFLDLGETDVVARSLDACCLNHLISDAKRRALLCALTALGQPSCSDEGARLTAVFSEVDCDDREAALFIEARKALMAQPSSVEFEGSVWTPVARRLFVHREVCDLLSRGHLSAAMRILVANSGMESPDTISGALLLLDAEVARLLLGDAPSWGGEETDRAHGVLSAQGVKGLASYSACEKLIRATLLNDAGAGQLVDELVSAAERTGERLVQVVALVSGCVLDLRRGANARACVRATLASAVSSEAGLGYLARVSTLLGGVARHILGDSACIDLACGEADDLGAVALLVREVMSSEADALVFEGDVPASAPRDALWLVLLLMEGLGRFSERLRAKIPPSWQRSLTLARTNWGAGGAKGEDVIEMPLLSLGEGRSARDGRRRPIEVCLLGGFSLTVRGVRVMDGRLDQRNAKSMFEYLLLQRGGSAKRYELVEQVWPECDYASGFNRAYQATSVIRRAISDIERDLDPFLIGRATKEVSLNLGLVGCDVSEFRACAKEAIDGSDEERVLEMAKRAEKLYVGDLYVPMVDATGYISAMRHELRGIYADAMVAGADAALRLGKERTAARLAANALSMDDLREDAVVATVRALRACGRAAEAEQQYRQYARRLAKVTSRPPSKRLRGMMGEGASGEPGKLEAEMG